jgi:hypothetical protein
VDYRGTTGLMDGTLKVTARHLPPYHRDGNLVDRVLVLLQAPAHMA